MKDTQGYQLGIQCNKDYDVEDLLEGLIDRWGINYLSTIMGGICEGKAKGLNEDEAKYWNDMCFKLWSI